MAPQFDHLADALDDATAPIAAELHERLERPPGEKDWLAITTALAKAAVAGLGLGAREFSEQLEEALPAGRQVSYELDIACTDLWAQRHGAASGRHAAAEASPR